MVIKSEIFIKCQAKNLTIETFVRIESRIIMLSNGSFWLEIIIYEVLLMLREKSVGLEASYQPLPVPCSQWHEHC